MFWNILFAAAGAAVGGAVGAAYGSAVSTRRVKSRLRRHQGRPLMILSRHKLREQATVLFLDNGQEAFVQLSDLSEF